MNYKSRGLVIAVAFIVVITGAFYYFENSNSGNNGVKSQGKKGLPGYPQNSTLIFCEYIQVYKTSEQKNIGTYVLPENATSLCIQISTSNCSSLNFTGQVYTFPVNNTSYSNSFGACLVPGDDGVGAENYVHIHGIYDVAYNDTTGSGNLLVYVVYWTNDYSPGPNTLN